MAKKNTGKGNSLGVKKTAAGIMVASQAAALGIGSKMAYNKLHTPAEKRLHKMKLNKAVKGVKSKVEKVVKPIKNATKDLTRNIKFKKGESLSDKTSKIALKASERETTARGLARDRGIIPLSERKAARESLKKAEEAKKAKSLTSKATTLKDKVVDKTKKVTKAVVDAGKKMVKAPVADKVANSVVRRSFSQRANAATTLGAKNAASMRLTNKANRAMSSAKTPAEKKAAKEAMAKANKVEKYVTKTYAADKDAWAKKATSDKTEKTLLTGAAKKKAEQEAAEAATKASGKGVLKGTLGKTSKVLNKMGTKGKIAAAGLAVAGATAYALSGDSKKKGNASGGKSSKTVGSDGTVSRTTVSKDGKVITNTTKDAKGNTFTEVKNKETGKYYAKRNGVMVKDEFFDPKKKAEAAKNKASQAKVKDETKSSGSTASKSTVKDNKPKPSTTPKTQTVAELWKEKTGMSWSEAKKQGLSDGSAKSNLELAKKLKAGTITKASLSAKSSTPAANNTPSVPGVTTSGSAVKSTSSPTKSSMSKTGGSGMGANERLEKEMEDISKMKYGGKKMPKYKKGGKKK
jgi:hypothetical protein